MPGLEVGVPDKMTVFQRCMSSFGRPGLPADEARALLTQLVHLFYVGETFPEAEAEPLFFRILVLFQKDSAGLKQMIYLAIKELASLSRHVMMGTSVLMRDVQQAHTSPESTLYRAQALRALCRILDAGAVESVDRLMRSAIVDKDEVVASAALVSGYHLLGTARDSVRRWATEIQEACGSPTVSQYHALGLLHEVRQHDSMALLKLVVSLADQRVLVDVNAQALHVRFVGELLADQPAQPQLLQILRGYLHNRSDIVSLEAAKVALSTQNIDDETAAMSLGVLRAYLESPRATSRFAAIRALNRFASIRPDAVSQLNEDIEHLVTDGNQSIATFAITALLKTGSESSVDNLIDRISGILREVPDDFRLVVVDAVRSLAKRYPTKHDKMLDFFAETLQHHGQYELKLAIVEAISDVLHADSATESLNNALMMLCEAIEDSEYPEVTIRVLHLLGSAGPLAARPSTYVRFIYNRVILENSVVRAAAISTLAKFVDVVPGAQKLIERSLRDPNDEVRDRAAVAFVTDAASLPRSKMAMADLEAQLIAYLAEPAKQTKAFDASHVEHISDEERLRNRIVTETAAADADVASVKPAETEADAAGASDAGIDFGAQLAEIPELAELGTLLHTGPSHKLTDDDMEYVVKSRAHLFASHLVLQFDITNNYELDLANVGVELSPDSALEELLTPAFTVPLAQLGPNAHGSAYVCYERSGAAVGYAGCVLQFTVDGEQDEYPIDDLEVRPADYIRARRTASPADHESQWAADGLTEETATHQLKSCANLSEAAQYLEKQLGMANCGSIPLESDTTATLLLRGQSAASEETVLVRAQLVKSARSGVAGKFAVRSGDADIAAAVADGV